MKTFTTLATAGVLAGAMAFSLSGCAADMSGKVPGTAQQVASATGTTTYRTADAGTIYIYDQTWNKLVYSGAVRPDQTVKVDTDHGQVLIDNQPVEEQVSLGSGDKYRFYLDTTGPSSTTIEHRTVIERETNE